MSNPARDAIDRVFGAGKTERIRSTALIAAPVFRVMNALAVRTEASPIAEATSSDASKIVAEARS